MARFKQVQEYYLFRLAMKFWGNLVRNFDNDIDDCFFDVVANNLCYQKGGEMIKAAYTDDELKAISARLVHRDLRIESDPLDVTLALLWNSGVEREKCRALLGDMKAYMIGDADEAKAPREEIENRFDELQETFRLNDLEREILTLSYLARETGFCWPHRLETRDKALYYAMAVDRDYAEVLGVMNPNGRLRKFDLLDADWDFNARTIGGFVSGVENEAIQRRFYAVNEEAEILPWNFYGDLARRDGMLLKRLLGPGTRKCNILLYGAPGTGKTSFARTLAREVGRTAWEVRQGEKNGNNMKAQARLVGIRLCNEQEESSDALMIVDEADELLRCGGGHLDVINGRRSGCKSTEKGVMNAILDEMSIPAIWISNAPAEAMDESVRRRFDYSIRFEALSVRQRTSVWRNVVAKHDLGALVDEARIGAYANRYATSAGGISMVMDNLKRLNPRPEEVEGIVAGLMKPHCQLMGVKDENRFLPAIGYSLDGLNIKGDVDLASIVGAVRNFRDESYNLGSEDRPRMNILLFGPPGTGKTEFVKYLGQQLDSKVLVMKASDLISKYVGESEQNIAAAFRQAESDRAILFLDEIDGLVQDRTQARANWEVSQVNEILQQMENFNGVMVAATNFCKNLDTAIMRRFTFKLEFGYLDESGKARFFERMFKAELADEERRELAAIQNLTPGDFRTVRQRNFYLGKMQTNAGLIAALKAECALKKDGGQMSRIGFAA